MGAQVGALPAPAPFPPSLLMRSYEKTGYVDTHTPVEWVDIQIELEAHITRDPAAIVIKYLRTPYTETVTHPLWCVVQ
uniref:Uncharacterized protein n=1 Tax=Marseillevirus LCMAC103 TaxID=2506604 RepID=A0A481YW24_9VIRU|nr:MAG: hypothetical protein LCMAC103_00350 [Marseillevirus LCMAC103]